LWALAKGVTNPWVSFNSGHFWTNRGTVSFWRRVLHNRDNIIYIYILRTYIKNTKEENSWT
jgi:hypothetical protein